MPKSVSALATTRAPYAAGRWIGGLLLDGDDDGEIVPRDHFGAPMVRLLP